jgi:hypothetical protein
MPPQSMPMCPVCFILPPSSTRFIRQQRTELRRGTTVRSETLDSCKECWLENKAEIKPVKNKKHKYIR